MLIQRKKIFAMGTKSGWFSPRSCGTIWYIWATSDKGDGQLEFYKSER